MLFWVRQKVLGPFKRKYKDTGLQVGALWFLGLDMGGDEIHIKIQSKYKFGTIEDDP
jgi:hypothetical protein